MEHKLAIGTEQWHCVMTEFFFFPQPAYQSIEQFIFHHCFNLKDAERNQDPRLLKDAETHSPATSSLTGS